jgi:hypothetical protein
MALAYFTAITTFLISWATTPVRLDAKIYYELLFWGGGHILQVANVAAMVAVWLILLAPLLHRPVLSRSIAGWLFGLLLAPHLAGPLLASMGTLSPEYRVSFTRLMQFGIAPVVLVIISICAWRIGRAWRNATISKNDLFSVPVSGFTASAALTLTGFFLGACIRHSNTMIPAHYHASIGAVTVAFMAISFSILAAIGCPLTTEFHQKLMPLQLALFGVGQVVFAIGFALGGIHGLSRKAYATEQHVRSFGEWFGLIIMSFGGLIAVSGGLLFLYLFASAIRPRLTAFISKWKLNPALN